MQNDGMDKSRRRFLTTAATVVGGAGAVAAAIPFISTMTPSAKTKAIGAPIEVDLSKLEVGNFMTVEWQGKPVWILRRGENILGGLSELNNDVSDPESSVQQQPEYAKNQYRSIKPEYLVVVGLCTHLGCSPKFVSDTDKHNLGIGWKGGFFCPCHGSRFDLAGRVFKGVPAPANLLVPPYQFLSDTRILIGDDSGAS